MSGPSTSQPETKEYVVRVPKSSRKKYHMMRFNADLGQEFFKSWNHCKIEKENNFKEFKEEETPRFGAGSEFGRELREEARRKRFGINVRKYSLEDQPWLLSVGAKANKKKYKGIREGGIGDHTGWYVFMQGKDGAFEAYPVEEWYNFQPINRYKALSAEEAEKEFEKRDSIMNYFQVMLEKKFKKDEFSDEEDGKKKGSHKKKLLLSEMDDWEDEDDDEERMDADSEDEEKSEKKTKKKRKSKRKSAKGGKKKVISDGASDDSCIEESDDYDEGAEHDYISGDSSDSEQENDEKVIKDLAGVEEGEALKKLLNSDEEDEEEKNSDNSDEDECNEKDAKKNKKSDKANSEDSYDSSDDEIKKIMDVDCETAVNKLKRKVKEKTHGMPDAKRTKVSAGAASSSNFVTSDCILSEESIRRYLMRKPMTATDLLTKFKNKKTGLDPQQLVQQIALILKRVNPAKQLIKGKAHFFIKV